MAYMFRRPSYSQAPEDEVILLNDGANPSASSPNIPRAPPRRRASYAHEPIRIDNSYDTPNRNITFSTWSSYVPVNSTLDDDKPLSDHDGTRNRTRARTTPTWHETLSSRLPKRNRKTWERLIIFVACSVVLIVLVTRGHHVINRASTTSKRRNPLKNSIPLHSFRANMKDGQGYVTSFPDPTSGLTSQLIQLFKLVRLSQRLDRAVILPELKATPSEGGDLPLSVFFDIDCFASGADRDMVEWQQVKLRDVPGTPEEILSCWGWNNVQDLAKYNIKTWFWPPPSPLTVDVGRTGPAGASPLNMTFPAIEHLVSRDQDQWLSEVSVDKFRGLENAPPRPERQLLCFDNLFYVPSTHFVKGHLDSYRSVEQLAPDDPVWSSVGVHLRFNRHINHIADELLYALMGSAGSKPFVAVHVRAGPGFNVTVDEYKRGVTDVQESLRTRRLQDSSWRQQIKNTGGRGKDLPVVFATDSQDPLVIRKLAGLGWIFIDHQEFASQARFGGWYPSVLDSVILSRATGFVGTKASTFSYVSQRRVEAWHDGVTTVVG